MDNLTDMGLLREYADRRCESAFAVLVSRYVNLVYSAALRKAVNPSAAEEITQAVFVILAKKAGRIPKQTILSGWLYQTARFTAASFLKSEARRARREQEAYMQTDLRSASDETWQRLAPLLEDAMGQLDERERAAVVLRFFEEKSFAEVAAAAGVSENAAQKRVARALENLRGHFSQRGVSSTTSNIAAAISAHSVHAAPAALAKSVAAVAVAQGTACGGSTLTLIKGALKIMAWTKAKMAIVAGVAVVLAAGTATVVLETEVLASREPSYNGRSLTEWQADLGDSLSQKGPKQIAAEEALRHMGTSALSCLLNDLTFDPKLRRHHIHTIRPDKRTADQRAGQAVRAFEVLGPLAKPAIPELARLLEQNPGYVPLALAGIGRDALPQLKQALTSSNFFVRDNTAAGLANAIFAERIAPADAEGVIPLAAKNLAYTDSNTLFEVNTRFRAADLIRAIRLDPDISVPALLGGLQDSHVTVATQCAEALGCFGPEAHAATSALIKTVASTNSQLSSAACSALSFIDPDALVRNVFPETVALTSNGNPVVRVQTVQTLGRIGPTASEAVQALIVRLKDSDEVVRMVSAQSLGLVAQHSDQAVPALTRALGDSSQVVRVESVNALGKFGSSARDAVAALLEVAKADAGLQGNVRMALESIDHNAAATLK